MARSKTLRDPSMYEFTEPTLGVFGRGHLGEIEQMQEKEPKYKDGHDPQMCTTLQRVHYLGQALRTAHDELDDLNDSLDDLDEHTRKMNDDRTRLTGEVRELMSVNEQQQQMIDELKKDKENLESQVRSDTRAKDLLSQLDKERFSLKRVEQLEKKLSSLHIDHNTAKNDLIIEKKEHATTKATLIKDNKQTVANLIQNHKQEVENLIKDYRNDKEHTKLKHDLTLEQRERSHLEEMMKLRDQQKPEVKFHASYRGGYSQQEEPYSSQTLPPVAGRIIEDGA
ncbi:MAG: hypothetical protein Q9219_005304 [cf. Caloplaca sp. 3 TL-2023]